MDIEDIQEFVPDKEHIEDCREVVVGHIHKKEDLDLDIMVVVLLQAPLALEGTGLELCGGDDEQA